MKMKTYIIEGATWAPRFMQKFWFNAATVMAKKQKRSVKGV